MPFQGGGAALLGMPVSIGGMAGSTIQAVSPGGLTLNPAIPAPAAFGTGTQVYLLQCITYQVIPPPDNLNLCQGNAPCLVRGAVPAVLVGPGGPPNCNQVNSGCIPIMDGVEDLQFGLCLRWLRSTHQWRNAGFAAGRPQSVKPVRSSGISSQIVIGLVQPVHTGGFYDPQEPFGWCR
ncbi:MAG: hypothetical protein HC938_04880 [Nitrospira sp.]|nr:hypothetical protein [Nitrospira sp.]